MKGKKANIGASGKDWNDPDVHNSKERRKIASLTLDEFTDGYIAPPNDEDYFRFRSPTDAWWQSFQLFSQAHLFQHSVCLAEQDWLLGKYMECRQQANKLTGDRTAPKYIRELLRAWLSKTPRFAIDTLTRNTSKPLFGCNGWDKRTIKALAYLGEQSGVSATTLFFIFSSKSMATSGLADANTDDLVEEIVGEWERWLKKSAEDFQGIVKAVSFARTNFEEI